MTTTRALAPILVSLLMVAAGCTGFAQPSGSGPSTQQTTPPPATEESTAPNATSNPASLTAQPARNYTQLYTETIDSVVKVVVRGPRGRSQGSGFVYSADGYLVTNQHVVGRAEQVQVRFHTGVWRSASVVGTDVYTDLAVLKIDSLPSGVEPLPLATTEPQQGQPVVALGSPLGYEGTITTGVVSGVNRSMRTERGFSIPDTVQTDAPINPGNSGGPLVSATGRVVGVNRAKQGDNLGFAISADVVRRVVPALIEDGRFRHPYMGIRTVPVTPPIATANDLSEVRGVMVIETVSDGPAAGVFQSARFTETRSGATLPVDGDVIVSIDGQQIRSQQELSQYLLLHTQPTEQVTVTVIRDGNRTTETLTLGRRPELGLN